MRRKIWIGFTVAGLLVASMITQGALGLPFNGKLSAHDPIDPLAPKEEFVEPMAVDPVDPLA